MRRPTILWVIPAPDPTSTRFPNVLYYLAWWPVYRTIRVVRHRLGLHDWRMVSTVHYHDWRKCDWCGAGRHR